MSFHVRQGDVLLEKTDGIPDGAKQVAGPIVLAYGEATGHAHTVEGRYAKLFETDQGERFIKASRKSMVRHQEHGPIALPKGTYRIVQQREYSPEAIRNVAD